jgi:hypothetical protein
MFGEKTSGQMADPGREQQIENEQDPSGQTGVQTGRADGVAVTSGVPQDGTEPNTLQISEDDDLRRFVEPNNPTPFAEEDN